MISHISNSFSFFFNIIQFSKFSKLQSLSKMLELCVVCRAYTSQLKRAGTRPRSPANRRKFKLTRNIWRLLATPTLIQSTAADIIVALSLPTGISQLAFREEMIGQFKRSGQHLIDRAAVVISTEIEARLVGRANVNFVRQLAERIWTKNDEKSTISRISHKLASTKSTWTYIFSRWIHPFNITACRNHLDAASLVTDNW